MGDIQVILSFLPILLLILLLNSPAQVQAPPSASQDLSRMEQVLREVRDLQTTQPGAAFDKLKPLLDELGQLYQRAALTTEGAKLYQEALLLQARAQARRLAPESEIITTFRQLLILNPKVDPSQFNPRELGWLDRIRTSESARLSIKSNPPSSSVLYLGQDLGTTPLELSLVAGTYRFVLRKQGYRDQEFEAALKAAETLIAEPTLRRSVVELPLSINAPNISILVNGQSVGLSQTYQAWLSSLPADRQEEYAAIVRQWGVDTTGASFFRLNEIPVEEPTTLEFRAACYEAQKIKISVAEQGVNWNRPIVILPELKRVALNKEIGSLDITSTPSGAEVWIDGSPRGKTPVRVEVCAGTHRVQVIHSAGQYVREVKTERGQVVKVSGEIKPALTFLGIYAVNPENQTLTFLEPDWDALSERLGLDLRFLSDTRLSAADLEALRKKGSLPLEQIAQGDPRSGDLGYLVKQTAAEAGRADLLLLGLKAEQKYSFRLYSTLHPIPDLIEVPDLKEESLSYLTGQLNKTQSVRTNLEAPDLGISLIDVPKGLAILKIHPLAPAAKTRLAPGMIIRSVDQKPMDYRALQFHLRSKKQGQTITCEVLSPGGLITVEVPVRFSGSEYPWSLPDGYPNCVLATLKHLVELEPEGILAKYANLSIALGLMHQKEWKLALDFLARATLEPQKPGIGLGSVLFYQGRCYEEMADSTLAQNYYSRAKDFPEATLGTPDGLMVPAMAERRLQFLKKPNR